MRHIIVLLALLTAIGSVAAQSFVRLSHTEITENGKAYYLHTVSRSETVYGICRAYGIFESDLLEANPFIKKGLQAGHRLKIPQKRNTQAAKQTEKPQREAVRRSSFAYHIVEEGETFYSISRHYGVSVDDLQLANSELTILQAGRTLRIPQSANENDAAKPLPHSKEKEYEQETPAEYYTDELSETHSAPIDVPEEQVTVPDYCNELVPSDKTIRVALLLSFGVSGAQADDDLQRAFEFAEFYEGVLIALEALKLQGAKIKLQVWDVNAANVRKIVTHTSFTQSDIIIGPVFPEEFAIAADVAHEYHIPIVSPLALVDSAQHNNKYVFQIAAAPQYLTQMLLQHCLAQAATSNTILITPVGKAADPQMEHLYRKYIPNLVAPAYQNRTSSLDSLHLAARIYEYENRPHSPLVQQINYQTGFLSRDNTETYLRVFARGVVNNVIVASEDEPFVSEVMATLNAFADYYACHIVVYGTNKWRKFGNIELETFYNLNLHIATPYFVDYEAEHVISFVKIYRNRYKTEPSQLAFQGYDVAKYFVEAIYRYGVDFEACLPANDVLLMQSVYRFATSSYRYHNNKDGILIRYDPETMKIVPYR
jgi:LysM repeat protein